MKKFLLLFLAIFLSFNISGEIKYKVSGKVVRNGQGLKNVPITISAMKIYAEKDEKNIQNINLLTSNDGEFQSYLIPGKYSLICNGIKPKKGETYGLRSSGIIEIIVKDKNISNIMLKVFTVPEAIQNNLGLLNEIPQVIPSVNYKYGRVPVFSESSCREIAVNELESLKRNDSDSNSVLNGASINDPYIFFDFQDNPIFYQYPIKNLGVEIGAIDVAAIGSISPEILNTEYLEISLIDLKDSRKDFVGVKVGIHLLEENSLDIFSKYKGFNKIDLKIIKYLCIEPLSDGLCLLIKNVNINKSFIINPFFKSVIGSEDKINEIRDFSETMITFYYIQDLVKSKRKDLL